MSVITDLLANPADPLVKSFINAGIEFDTTQKRWTTKATALQSKRHLTTAWKALTDIDREGFQKSLSQLVDRDASLKLALLPLLPASARPTASTSTINMTTQDSLIRILAELPGLQTRLIARLLDKLPEYDQGDSDAKEANIPKLILGQLRWLPWIENSKMLATHVLDALNVVSSLALKRDLITWIADTADDAAIDVIVPALIEQIQGDQELLPPGLDTLSNIRLPDDQLELAQETAINLLRSANPEHVPVLVKFLFHVVKQEQLAQLFKDLRQHLKLESLVSTSARSVDKNCPAMLLECLRAGMVRQEVVTTFLQEFSAFTPKEGDRGLQHSLLDLWLLYLIHANFVNHRAKVEQVLRKKLQQEHVKSALLSKSIIIYPTMLQNLHSTLMNLAQMLMQTVTQDPEIGQTLRLNGTVIYTAVFKACEEDRVRLELLGKLLQHVSSQSIKEVDGALDTLEQLSIKLPHLLEPYANVLQGLIDFMDGTKLENPQLVRIYFLFARIAYPKGPISYLDPHESKMASFLMMLIHKQMANAESRYQQMAAFGYVAVLCSIGAPPPADMQLSDEQVLHLQQSAASLIGEVLTVRSPESLELFFDEFHVTFLHKESSRPLRPDFISVLAAKTADFVLHSLTHRATAVKDGQQNHANSLPDDEEVPAADFLPPNIWCDIIHVVPMTESLYTELQSTGLCLDLTGGLSYDILAPFASLLRLLLTLHADRPSDTGLVHCLCLNMFPKPMDSMTKLQWHSYLNSQQPKEVEFIANQLMHALNILRELINATARVTALRTPDPDVAAFPFEAILAERLKQAVQVEAFLEATLDHLSEYPSQLSSSTPLLHGADILRPTVVSTKLQTGRTGRKSSKQQPKFSAGKKTEEEEDEEEDEDGMDMDEESADNDSVSEDHQGATPRASASKAGSSDTSSSNKTFGYLGPFDRTKYRRNVTSAAAAARTRFFTVDACNALDLSDQAYFDNQIRYLLLTQVLERTDAIMPKKLSLNVALQKSDPLFIRDFPSFESVAQHLLPAYLSLSTHLVYLSRASAHADEAIKDIKNEALGGFGIFPLCDHLRTPCLRIILQLLKRIFSSKIFDIPIALNNGDIQTTWQLVMAKVVAALVEAANSAPLDFHSVTELRQACFAKLASLIEYIQDFESVVALVEVLYAVTGGIEDNEEVKANLQNQTSVIIKDILDRYWTDGIAEATEENSIFKENPRASQLDGLKLLLSLFIQQSTEPVESNTHLAKMIGTYMTRLTADNESAEPAQDATVDPFKTLTKGTVVLFAKVSLNSAIFQITQLKRPGKKTSDDVEHQNQDEQQEDAQRTTNDLNGLVQRLSVVPYILTRLFTLSSSLFGFQKPCTKVALKDGKAYIEAFSANCDWACAEVTNKPRLVQRAIHFHSRSVQALQNFCSSVKQHQLKQMGSLVAPLKKSMEQVMAKLRAVSDKHDFGDLLELRASRIDPPARPQRPSDEASTSDQPPNHTDDEETSSLAKKKRKRRELGDIEVSGKSMQHDPADHNDDADSGIVKKKRAKLVEK